MPTAARRGGLRARRLPAKSSRGGPRDSRSTTRCPASWSPTPTAYGRWRVGSTARPASMRACMRREESRDDHAPARDLRRKWSRLPADCFPIQWSPHAVRRYNERIRPGSTRTRSKRSCRGCWQGTRTRSKRRPIATGRMFGPATEQSPQLPPNGCVHSHGAAVGGGAARVVRRARISGAAPTGPPRRAVLCNSRAECWSSPLVISLTNPWRFLAS